MIEGAALGYSQSNLRQSGMNLFGGNSSDECSPQRPANKCIVHMCDVMLL